MSSFTSPDELKLLLEFQEEVDFEMLREAWYRSVRTWSFKDIIRGKQIISAYADRVVL